MIDFVYAQRGILALSRAHRAGGMAGHLGSGVLAGYFFGEIHPELEPGVHLGIERDLERIMAGEESIWFDQKKAGVTIPEMFQTGEKSVADGDKNTASAKDRVAGALEKSMGQLRQSGHNVIFASIAIRALEDHGDFASEEVVSGIEKLMATFEKASQGRGYYGESEGWKTGAEVDVSSVDPSPGKTLDAVAERTIDYLIRTGSERRRGFGGPFHLIDHAAALFELESCGYPELALRGIPAFKRHLRLLESLPVLDEELGPLKKSEEDPMTASYWSRRDSDQHGAWLTHRIKVLYGLSILLPSIEEEKTKEQAREAFRYLMA